MNKNVKHMGMNSYIWLYGMVDVNNHQLTFINVKYVIIINAEVASLFMSMTFKKQSCPSIL